MSIQNARVLFEIPKDITYLNCANMAPQLRCVTDVGWDAVRAQASPWKLSAPEWFSGAETLRGLAARVLGADGDGIALVPAVSYGVAVATTNLSVSPDQTIVLLDQQFPSNVYAWLELARKTGGRIVTVRRPEGASWTKALENVVDENTAIVAVPQCHWTDGSKIDLERVGKCARECGSALVIDAGQSLGACLFRHSPSPARLFGCRWLQMAPRAIRARLLVRGSEMATVGCSA